MTNTRAQKGRLEITQTVEGDAALLRLSGAMDETFAGFDPPPNASQVVIELGALVRITSYGVRQWIRARDQLAAKQLFYLNCPPFFVDQLNMVLNFAGHGQVITAFAPFSCPKCRSEKWILIDVIGRHDELTAGKVSDEHCAKCQARMEMDELPETYLGFVKASGARALSPQVAPLLAAAQLYRGDAPVEAPGERVQVQKLVHDRVTYFRFSGAVDKRFRARSLLEGTEGEVVLDLREVSVTPEGRDEWQRLRAGLTQRASLVTLVDVPASILDMVLAGSMSLGGAVVYSIMGSHKCDACARTGDESMVLGASGGGPKVCSACGGTLRFVGKAEHLQLATRLTTGPILASTLDTIQRRDDLLSRARIEAESAAPEIRRKGSILGKYEINRALSVGGMAEVFLAVQKGIGGFEKPVALKRIRRSVLERRHFAVEQFLNEAKIAATLAHPNIAQIFDVGEEEGLLYLAMEYVHGKDLRVLLRRLKDRGDKMPLGAALHIVQQIAGALHHAYTQVDLNGRQLKAIHRDVSPHNILVGYDGVIKLVDFGVATSAATGQEPGQVAGKHNYMSPEQLTAGSLDARADLFSLGVVLYELLAGERPFQHENREETLQAVNEARYRPLSQMRPDLPKSIDKLMQKLLAKKPADRFRDGNQVSEALGAFARESGVSLDNHWLQMQLPGLFKSADSEVDEAGFTPHSDSFSLNPTNDRIGMEAGTPSAQRRRRVGYSSGSIASLDEQTLSQIVSPAASKKKNIWMFFTLILLAALVALLWWRY